MPLDLPQRFCRQCKRIYYRTHSCNRPLRLSGEKFRRWLTDAQNQCQSCEHYGTHNGRQGCDLSPTKPCDTGYHQRNGNGCFDLLKRYPSYIETLDIPAPPAVDLCTIVTTHFNPTGSRRIRETFNEWKTLLGELGPHVRCYELTLDGRPQEIEGAYCIRGDSSNVMWQKEALLNVALAQCETPCFAWIDHDICIGHESWLTDSIELLQKRNAVQLFSRLTYWDQQRKPINTVRTRCAGGGGAPGGAWIAKTDYLKSIGGFYPFSVVGSGDEWAYAALSGDRSRTSGAVRRLPESMRAGVLDYLDQSDGSFENVDCLQVQAYHLYHGDRRNRQYETREKILQRHGFDPARDVKINAAGVLEWSTDKSELHREVRQFFIDRRDDG